MNIQLIDLENPLWLETLEKLDYDIYHLPQYVYLESKRTNSVPEAILIVDHEKIFFLPYLLRRCDNLFDDELNITNVFDVVSPYGYAGFLLNQAAASAPEFLNFAIQKLTQVWRDKQVCSVFLRTHPILNEDLNRITNIDYLKVSGETISINLTLDEKEIWYQTRAEHRTKINRCKRAGFIAKIVPFKQYINEFNFIYEETMARVGAAKLYYFGLDFFNEFVDLLGDRLHVCIVELNEQITCAGLFTECNGIVQYHLGGTKTSFLKQAPSKLMFDYVRFWAKERGNQVFHLGGGVGSAKDSLYHFKAGFSKQRHNFQTFRLIVDTKQYLNLVKLRAKYLNTEAEKLLETDFFPAYRLPNSIGS